MTAVRKPRKKREEITNIEQPTVDRLSGGEIIVGKVKIICRALTYWEAQYIDAARMQAQGTTFRPDGTVLIEGDKAAGMAEVARLCEKLGIESITGMPVEVESRTLGGRRLEIISDSTLELLPGQVRGAIAITVQ